MKNCIQNLIIFFQFFFFQLIDWSQYKEINEDKTPITDDVATDLLYKAPEIFKG